jgi:general secretion pathway protein D
MRLNSKHKNPAPIKYKLAKLTVLIGLSAISSSSVLANSRKFIASLPPADYTSEVINSNQAPANEQLNQQANQSKPTWSKEKGAKSLFSFPDTEIDVIVQAVAFAANKHIIIDPRVKGKISFASEKPITAKQALALLSPILRMRRYALIEDGNYIRIIPEEDARTISSKVIHSGKAPNTGQIYTQIFHLKYESAGNIVSMIRNLIPVQNASTLVASQPNSSSNAVIVSDYADNLQRIANIIAVLDVPKQTNSNVQIVNLEYAMASDIAAIISKVLDSNSNASLNNNSDTSKVNITVDNRTNAIVLASQNSTKLTQYKELIASLDKPTAQQGNIWVVPLKNADANSVAQTLRAVLSGDSSSSTSNSNNSSTKSSNSSFNNSTSSFSSLSNSSSGSNSSSLTSSSANANFPQSQSNSLGGQVQADVATNSLIITATEMQYKSLRNVIDKLDVQRAQVFVESMIVEISDQKVAELGVQWQGLIGGGANRFYVGNGSATNNIAQVGTSANTILSLGNGASTANIQNLAGATTGFNIAWLHEFGKTFGLAALAKALNNQSGVNILSTPNLLTLDNEEAKIIIGQNVPFITGQYSNTSGTSSSVNPFQTIERNDVGLTLRVKPQVSANNKVKLRIYQETSSIDDKSNASGIITNKRAIDTTVEVKNGEPIVLGGLLEDIYSDGIEKVPGLSKIPIIGGLFRYEKKTIGKKNLMLFLRPYVVLDNGTELTTTRYDYIKQQQIDYKPSVIGIKEKTYPVLPDLKVKPTTILNGLSNEIKK